MSLFDRRPTYNLRLPVLMGTATFTGLTAVTIVGAIMVTIVLNVGLAPLGGWLFQMFWAWYVPAISSAIPMLDFWYSVATVVVISIYLRSLKGHEPKK